jgi:hypothetical protein
MASGGIWNAAVSFLITVPPLSEMMLAPGWGALHNQGFLTIGIVEMFEPTYAQVSQLFKP